MKKLGLLAAAIIVGGLAFVVGRFVERRANEELDSRYPVRANSLAPAQVKRAVPSTDDERKCQEIGDLYGQVSQLNWKLVTPFGEFQAGNISAKQLRERTAGPELDIMRLCIRMHELANGIDDIGLRHDVLEFTAAVLQQQRGFGMMIQGLSADDEVRVAAGARLFEDGRNKSLAAVLKLGPADNPHAAHLNRLLDAYESAR